MRRAIQLARNSMTDTHPNPNVGAVIVADGRIIGEGYHRRCGQAHAEVNAVNSVSEADRGLLSQATIYVTLEPCSHYGKTPPCAKLIIDTGIPRVVIACGDPFDKVRGRGVKMLRDAGIEVVEGVLEDEARTLNPKFFTAHTRQRPYITLKWAQSADGFMDVKRGTNEPSFRFSTPLDTTLVHRERALHDTVLTTAKTVLADNPGLDVRLWEGPNPTVIILDRSGRLNGSNITGLKLFTDPARRIILLSPTPITLPNTSGPDAMAPTKFDRPNIEHIKVDKDTVLTEIMSMLYQHGITSLMTECGPTLLNALIADGLYDNKRIYISSHILGSQGDAPIWKDDL